MGNPYITHNRDARLLNSYHLDEFSRECMHQEMILGKNGRTRKSDMYNKFMHLVGNAIYGGYIDNGWLADVIDDNFNKSRSISGNYCLEFVACKLALSRYVQSMIGNNIENK